jgi:hypothetical protein
VEIADYSKADVDVIVRVAVDGSYKESEERKYWLELGGDVRFFEKNDFATGNLTKTLGAPGKLGHAKSPSSGADDHTNRIREVAEKVPAAQLVDALTKDAQQRTKEYVTSIMAATEKG